ncbi:hypothetical protein MUNTM_46380 [Mycobacterium sp. MUNTM1]
MPTNGTPIARWRWAIQNWIQLRRERRLAHALRAHLAASAGESISQVCWRRMCTPTEIFTWYVISPEPPDVRGVRRIMRETASILYAEPFRGDNDLRIRVEWRVNTRRWDLTRFAGQGIS